MKAFPNKGHESESLGDKYDGMDLRDYFAGQALAGGLEQGVENDMQTNWWHSPVHIAQRAYEIADAMMQERKK